MTPAELETVVARSQIEQVLYRYCRGIDRMDADLVSSCFADEATLTYAPLFQGTVREFVDWVWPIHRDLVGHSHVVNNVVCEVRGPKAVSEAYGRITLRSQDERGLFDIVNQGRYLDRWQRREDAWVIVSRLYVRDLRTIVPVVERDTSAAVPAYQGGIALVSARDDSDPSYRMLSDGRRI